MKQLLQNLWVKLFLIFARRLPWGSRKSIGARSVLELSFQKTQVTLVVWDLTNPNWSTSYSREELVNMLALVRHCERQMRWGVPEPKEGDTHATDN